MHYVPGFIRKETVVSKLAVATQLAGLWALPQSASAQAEEAATDSEPTLQEPPPSAEPSRDEGGLSPRVRKRTRQQWDPSVYEVPTTSRRETRSHPALGAGIGLGISVVSLVGGIAMVVVGVSGRICISFGEPCTEPDWVAPVLGTGAILSVGGLVGIVASSIALGDSDHGRAGLKEPKHGRARRVQWDPGASRLVF